jgi:hypothetical protein
VLNLLDTDEEAARALRLEHITEQPFSPISDDAYRRARQLVQAADAVIIADAPFGRGNLRNLELARWAQEHGKPIFALESRPIETRDFTDGAACTLWRTALATRHGDCARPGRRCWNTSRRSLQMGLRLRPDPQHHKAYRARQRGT